MTPLYAVVESLAQVRLAPEAMDTLVAVRSPSKVRLPALTVRLPVKATSPVMVQEPVSSLTRFWKLRTSPSSETLPTRVSVLTPPPSMMPRTVAPGPRVTLSLPEPSWMAMSVALAARMLPVLMMVQSASLKVRALVRLMVPEFVRLVRLVRLPEKSSVAPEATVMELVAREPVTLRVPALTVVAPV